MSCGFSFADRNSLSTMPGSKVSNASSEAYFGSAVVDDPEIVGRCGGSSTIRKRSRSQSVKENAMKISPSPAKRRSPRRCSNGGVNTVNSNREVMEKFHPDLRNNACSPLQNLQKLYSQKRQLPSGKMMIIIVDEMDYLITKDRGVLHDLFMLSTLPYSRCILIGIANAINLADRFLPRLESLNCKPTVVTFCAYSKDQILKIIHQRLSVLGYDIFEAIALEFCARKVAAASGDMRRALNICRSAIEVFEAELKHATNKEEVNIVRFDHMEIALSRAFKPVKVDTIQSLPQHQQLNQSYSEFCKDNHIPAVGMHEFTIMCGALSDQGLLNVGRAKEVIQKKVTLKVDSSDVRFALKEIRFFNNCLE
ncbi:hypothetical protein J5N97_002455 [Dioscorea zingiberensis]|uniref:Cell division control protein n=1 Tax=Dioscorea zingiberensis TaxID=325984 RepID=A0A9D5D3U3_9LILI|nr:hypothetical protein J5N97_002455 [Dioscorea zingiberensis]